jgi:DNA-binding transcriptional MerR regulator
MRYSGLSRQTIHNYTCMGLITESERTESNHRLYDEDVFSVLQKIEELKPEKTLLEIREILDRNKGVTYVDDRQCG